MQYSTLRQVTPPVEGFYVYVRHIDKDDDRDYIRYPVNGADERSHRIDTLEPEETYDIKMKSFNDEGESNRSKVLRCTTLSKLQAIYFFFLNAHVYFFKSKTNKTMSYEEVEIFGLSCYNMQKIQLKYGHWPFLALRMFWKSNSSIII